LVAITDNNTSSDILDTSTTIVRHNRPPGGASPDSGEIPFYLEIDPTNDPNSDLTVCYTDREASQGGDITEDNLVLFQYNSNTWTNIGYDVRDTDSNCVTKHNVIGDGIWTLATQTPLAGHEIAPLSLTFDVQHADTGETVSQTVVITNHNSTDLRIISVDLLGDDAEHFAIVNDTSETTLTPGSARTIWISFDPSSTGVKTASLQITTDDESTVAVALSGTGSVGTGMQRIFLPLVVSDANR
jgi:hypothetical protein